MSDTIFVNGLMVRAFHGVMPHEAKVGQSFSIDLALEIDLERASKSDKLADTVSYDQVAMTASDAFTGKRFRLVEAAAGAMVEAIFQAFPKISGITVTVRKPHAPVPAIFGDVGVIISRRRG